MQRRHQVDLDDYAEVIGEFQKWCAHRKISLRHELMDYVQRRMQQGASDMGFEPFVPSTGRGLTSRRVRINGNGQMQVHREDLQIARIGDKVTLLLDRGNFRLAIRAPRDNELPVKLAGKDTSRTKAMPVSSALKELGLEVEQVKGVRDCMHKDEMIIVQFDPPKAKRKP